MSDSDPKAKALETCRAIYRAGIPMNWCEYSPDLPGGYLLPEHPSFINACTFSLEKTQKSIARSGNSSFTVWSPLLIQTAADFAKRHHLKLEMSGGLCRDRKTPLGVLPDRIRMGLTAPLYFLNLDHFIFLLEHEEAHLKDDSLVTMAYPEMGRILLGDIGSLKELSHTVRKISEAYLKMFEDQIPEGERGLFRSLRKKVFGDLETLSRETLVELRMLLAEILRSGEEIFDPLFEAHIMRTVAPFNKKREDNKKPTWTDLFIIASVQEAGLWEKFTRHKDFKPASMEVFDKESIRFFRMMLHAASRYFYSCLR